MYVKYLIEKLKEHPNTMSVYMQKKEYFGNVGDVFSVIKTTHPNTGKPCILLVDGEEEMERPYLGISTNEYTANVRALIKVLEMYDGDIEVMTKPGNGRKNFCDIQETELSSYGFFGKSIPCVLLVG